MIYGVDVGDGESAVARLGEGAYAPEVLSIGGEKSIVSALAVMQDGTLRIGGGACQLQPGMKELHLRFKQKFLSGSAEAELCIERFARALYVQLERDGYFEGDFAPGFLIGCPSGWNDAAKERYRQLFERAGFTNARVTPESRAAFLAAREAGILQKAGTQLDAPALIIDAGSSTTDFTVVTRFQVTDSGEVRLGAGLLDKAILDMNLGRTPQSRELGEHLKQYPQYVAYCELAARRVKEMLFNAQARGVSHEEIPCEMGVKLYTLADRPTVEISLTDGEMEKLLRRPLEALDGESYLEAYRHALLNIKNAHTGAPIGLILMTGGASRMGFMRTLAQEIFPQAQVVMGTEPEFSIARGLCHALHLDEQTAGFEKEAKETLSREAIEHEVLEALPELYVRVTPVLLDAMIKNVAVPVFEGWKSGHYRTLKEMQAALEEQSTAYFTPETTAALIRAESAEWLGTLRRHLQELTDPLCEKYGLPVASLRLPDAGAIPFDASQFTPGGKGLVDLSQMKLISDLIVASVAAMLCGGGGIAMVVSGPIGLIVGALAGWLVSRGVGAAAEKLLWSAPVPLLMRKLFSTILFENGLSRKREAMLADMQQKLIAQLENPDARTKRMTGAVADAVTEQLEENLQRAVMLLR